MFIRLMTSADLPFADSLREIAGWNQVHGDWRRFLALEPNGCFVAEKDGHPAGVATTTVYEERVAWIGMVLVDPAARGAGIGTALLNRCLESLRDRKIPCVKLDATPAGQPLYEKLGFRAEWTLSRWEGRPDARDLPAVPEIQLLEPVSANASFLRHRMEGIQTIDTSAFGISRRRLLEALLPKAKVLAWAPGPGSDPALSYGMLRTGSRAIYLGPAVTSESDDGVALAAALLREAAGNPVYWDLPEAQGPAISFLEESGFKRQRSLLRMCLGQNLAPGDPRRQLALADPATG